MAVWTSHFTYFSRAKPLEVEATGCCVDGIQDEGLGKLSMCDWEITCQLQGLYADREDVEAAILFVG